MPKSLAIFLRSLWYVLKLALIIACILLLVIGAFTIGKNLANFYVLVTDGLNCRAQVVLEEDADSAQLYKYFSRSFIQNDPVLKLDNYQDYGISNFDQRTKVEWMWMWPWENNGYAIVEDTVRSIEGTISDDKLEEDPSKEVVKDDPPDWFNAKYSIKFKTNSDGRWFIADMIVLEELPPPVIPTMPALPGATVLSTPHDSASPTPALSPTPAMTPSPTPEE